ncbi:Beta-galactosidase [Arcticibacter svalbardensis MN12-7]|uniref:Beta-galactosidase n=1 Tax=Arcticibacter svalbardensis MN12-7 TaxID=1150600 RepID=R9GR57_9SPHI|nr:beta-galactosidase [Arcticibacter svalbardensis]EOR94158.1 Beta-galactosidase [Arcticibacter svalbardensis MN12-7]
MNYRRIHINVIAIMVIGLLCHFNNSWSQTSNRFFKESDPMRFGVYYYPEQWPEEDWEKDISKIASLGFDFTHFGEFAWSKMEPEEGKYDYSWLDKAIALAARNNLKIILCTPTATPPVWLTNKYPEILMVNAKGTTIQHGARQQGSWSSVKYREYIQKIVEQLAKRYANNPTVLGWQIDNEPSHYSLGYDYNASAQSNYKTWLKKKYGSIDTLNAVWGNAFWSHTYNNFDQIRIPNQNEIIQKPITNALLDFKRFTADELADFIHFQQKILRQYISPNQWITTNITEERASVDPQRMGFLDVLSYTKYMVAGTSMGIGKLGFRIGSPTSIGYGNDFIRPITGNVGVMELQPGQVNWGKYNPQPLPGAIRLWMYDIWSGGNKFLCTYRFRQPLSGIEQYHGGIINTDGNSLSRGGREFVDAMNEIKAIEKLHPVNKGTPAKVGLLYSVDSRWETDNQPQTEEWSYISHHLKYYKVLNELGVSVDVIDENVEFSKYSTLVVTAFQLTDKSLIERWKQYAEQGGQLVITCRTAQKDREAHLWKGKLSSPIYDLIGATDMYFDHLPPTYEGLISYKEKNFTWNNWADILTPNTLTEVWASYADQFYKGKAAVLHKKTGVGSVTYIGPDTDSGDLEKAVLKEVFQQAKIPFIELPEGVIVRDYRGLKIGLNYSSSELTLPLKTKSSIISGQQNIKPAGVLIWK